MDGDRRRCRSRLALCAGLRLREGMEDLCLLRVLLGDREREVSDDVKDRARSPRLGLLRPTSLPTARRSGVADRERERCRYLVCGALSSLY